jgi:hypothetical protein
VKIFKKCKEFNKKKFFNQKLNLKNLKKKKDRTFFLLKKQKILWLLKK